MLNPNFVIVGTLIGAVGSIGYLIDTVKGNVRPNRVSFLLWSIVPCIAFAAQLNEGVGMESLMTLSTGLLPLMIFFASFVNKKSEWKSTQFDVICGVLSFLGMILWLVTKVGNIAIAFSILADGLAAIPTIVKAYKYPDTETAWPWITTPVGIVVTLMTLTEFTFANSSFIIYVLILNTLIFSLVQFRIGEKLR